MHAFPSYLHLNSWFVTFLSLVYPQLGAPLLVQWCILPQTRAPLAPFMKSSPLCPHVSAPDRCLHWMSPFSLRHLNMLSSHVPAPLIAREHVILVKAVKPKTLSNYGAGLLRFIQFCDALNILEDLWMPAPEWLLSIFITTRGAGSVSGGTLRSWLLGLQLWHVINGASWHGTAHLKMAVQGSKNV